MKTCGVLFGAISKELEKIVEFITFERKRQNKVKRVENNKIQVTIKVDIV